MTLANAESVPQADQKSIETKVNSNGRTNGSINDNIIFTGKVVQITNVSPGTTLQQIATLFGYLGTVIDIRMYPSDESQAVAVKLCYIKYENSEQCGVAQHLTNTVFIDKALIVVPMNRDEIPEEKECVHLLRSINAYAGLPTVISIPGESIQEEKMIAPLPTPPIITSTTDPVEIDEIRRTIFVKNINQTVTSEQVMAFFSGVGEVKYLRINTTPEHGKYAFVEFSAVESVATAMQYNGVLFGNRCLSVDYAKSAISKPESEKIASGRTPVRRMRDVDVRNPSLEMRKSYSRSPVRRRSRSHSRKRSRSPSHSRRRRSRSRSRRNRSRSDSRRRRRSRSRSRGRRKRSKSRSRTRSPRKRRSKSRSKSKEKKRRSRSRSPKKKKKKSRSQSRSPSRKKKSRSRSLSTDRRKKRSSRSRSRSTSRRQKPKKSSSKSPDHSSSKKKKKDKEKKRGTEEDTEKELKSLLTKIYDYEQGKDKEKDKTPSKNKKEKD